MHDSDWWLVVTAYATGVMAVTDATTHVPHLRVETWVVLLFAQMVSSILLLDDVRTHVQKGLALLWLSGCFFGLYNVIWFVTELVFGHIFWDVGLYPFGFTVTLSEFVFFESLGIGMLWAGAKISRL